MTSPLKFREEHTILTNELVEYRRFLAEGAGRGRGVAGAARGSTHPFPHLQQQELKEVVFFDLPEMLVNLNSSGRQTNYLKLTVSLEIDDPLAVERLEKLVERLEKLLPRIVDNFQVYLRELRVEDLSGSAGVYRLKEELLARVNAAVEPINVTDVLFKEMLVQ